MAGRGRAPKDPARLAGKGAAKARMAEVRVIHTDPSPQPELPTIEVEKDGEMTEFAWPARTVEWWQMWAESPLSEEFTQNDWSELLDTALLHARYWKGNMSLAPELRLRVAKFGATPEDRARLRIQFAAADEAEDKRSKSDGASARERRGPLRDAG